jgi:hypothetical protein
MNYTEASALLKTARVQANGKKINNNTYVVVDGENVAVKLHNTNVVIFAPDGTITLNSGTWRTPTTKDRMNIALRDQGVQITANKGMWYIGGSIFYDGITIKDGVILNPQVPQDVEPYKKKVDKLVKAYIDGFVDHIVQNGLEESNAGDCWPCHLKAEDGRPDPMGIDHYLSHFEEKYYVPSLFFNAFLAKGYGNPAFVWDWMKTSESFRKTESRAILTKYFRTRKLLLAEELRKHAVNQE